MADLISIDANQATLSGDLSFDSVPPLMLKGRQLMAASGGEWCVDMAQVTRASSVGIALLLDWVRYANQEDIDFRIQAMPELLQPIINISDLDALFAPLLVA